MCKRGRAGRLIVILLASAVLAGIGGVPARAEGEPEAPSGWAIEYVQRALELEILPPGLNARFTEPITREEYCVLAVRLYERAAGTEITARQEFLDCEHPDVVKIGGLGVVQGVGEGNFAPQLTITREEAAVIIDRLLATLGRPLEPGATDFADVGEISEWAFEAAGRVREGGIMVGGGDNTFEPKASLTIEQTIKTMLVIHDFVMPQEYVPEPSEHMPETEFETEPVPEPEPLPGPNPVPVSDLSVAGRHIPILMYHAVADIPRTSLESLFVRPSELEAQFRYIVENGFETITFDDLSNIGAFEKPIMLTFDDGYRDNYTSMFPLLQAYGLKATIFIITDSVWGNDFLTEPQILEMAASGLVSFQSHTRTHPPLTSLPSERLRVELLESKLYLENLTGQPVSALCYPAGIMNGNVKIASAEFYKYAVLNVGGQFVCGGDLLAMERVRINRGVSLDTFAALVN